ncbi:Outer membrane receptor protein mostly Fe transport [Paramagnetospirillum magnetotacticum MS-1]|uniref:Outer membrane receptor protein mostly Fe transport n=1 Tax=Paramagnetospirillum magnetotacticum MS-1 TaxID=272627 RepID=A0A0C2YIA9_PARME|nr:TonB-dependent receptor [Paramagnetospirillum magnetotacticum]KIL99479.1 Outer membrane receptor protein mostly Fe transport [Paramagnetospirillum magnetotacticum MS-1]
MGKRGVLFCGTALWVVAQAAAWGQEVVKVPMVDVIGVSPVPGTGISRDQMPSNVQGLDGDVLDRAKGATVSDLLERRLGSVSLSDTGGNSFQPSLSFRGFNASPVMGEPQGLAVYQNGMRVNESFGDLVHWEMIPTFAVNRADILPGANPVFGLNALGGAMVMDMKTGFSFQGTEMMAAGGSFGRYKAVAQHGAKAENFGFYGGIGHMGEEGWRQRSPSELSQMFGDVEFRGERFTGGLSLSFGNSDLTGNGPSPVELLHNSRSAIFTSPDTSQNRQISLSGRGNLELTDTLSLQGAAYFRNVRHRTLNGDANTAGACSFDATILCSDPNGADEAQLTDINGNTVPVSAKGSGIINRTETNTNSLGASLQLALDKPVWGLRNTLITGLSEDEGHTRYHSESEVGSLQGDRSIGGSGVILGTSTYWTDISAHNRTIGVYFSDTLSLTDRLTLTMAGRYNAAEVVLEDRFGTDLNGRHMYERFNPAAGLTYQLSPELTAFAGYGEANRAPTAAELSCADAAKPCRFPNAFLSDPSLRQVVSRSVETGLRGRSEAADKSWSHAWSLAGFGTQNQDDILFVASGQSTGTGYFRNAGRTLRTGLEASDRGRFGPMGWFVNYSLVRATMDNDVTLRSPNNPGADANGNIFVRRGSPLPGIPMHSLKMGGSYELTDAWLVEMDAAFYSSRRLRGDEAGLGRRLGGYEVFNAETEYKLADFASAFLRVDNLLDRRYESFGLYGSPTSVFSSFSDNQFRTPGAPRSFWAGLRARF